MSLLLMPKMAVVLPSYLAILSPLVAATSPLANPALSLGCLPATLYSSYVKFSLLFKKDTLFSFIQDIIMYFLSPG